MATTDPAIVVVHGAWHTPSHYHSLLFNLNSAGYRHVYCPRLPSCSLSDAPSNPLPTAGDDAKVVHTVVHQLRTEDANRHIILILHSYGGVVGSEALGPSFDPIPGGLANISLIYVAAFMLPKFQSAAGAYVDPTYPIEGFEDGTALPKDPKYLFFNGLTDEMANEEARSIVKMSGVALRAEVGFEAWKVIGTTATSGGERDNNRIWYVVMEDDHAIPPDVQRRFVEGVRSEGVTVKEVGLSGPHTPWKDARVVNRVVDTLREILTVLEIDGQGQAGIAAC
ncbi:MAG: hypothetical protein M1820_002728 [Bogoriella megaspora]|nr:MAG: hypothetical protein M1820_002728 [Bogoriella megaspora]